MTEPKRLTTDALKAQRAYFAMWGGQARSSLDALFAHIDALTADLRRAEAALEAAEVLSEEVNGFAVWLRGLARNDVIDNTTTRYEALVLWADAAYRAARQGESEAE